MKMHELERKLNEIANARLELAKAKKAAGVKRYWNAVDARNAVGYLDHCERHLDKLLNEEIIL